MKNEQWTEDLNCSAKWKNNPFFEQMKNQMILNRSNELFQKKLLFLIKQTNFPNKLSERFEKNYRYF